jgi:hypothetical protein
MLYWSIGQDILDQQQADSRGEGVIERIADDLRDLGWCAWLQPTKPLLHAPLRHALVPTPRKCHR